MRTDLPATPKVGTSRLKSSTSGSRVRLPTGTAKTGTPRIRRRGGRLHRRRALVPVAVGGQHDAAQVLRSSAEHAASGSFRSVPWPGLRLGERLDHDVHPLPQLVPRRGIGQRGDRLAAGDRRCDVGWSAGTTSRVSMLAEASQSTAIAGFSSGRNSSIHSG